MLRVTHQVRLALDDVPDAREELLGEIGEAGWFRQRRQGFARAAEEAAVGVYGAREGGGEPVEGDVGEDCVEGWVFVGPFEEFFADPVWGGLEGLDGV